MINGKTKERARFERQFRLLSRNHPRLAAALEWLMEKRWRPLRFPLGVLLSLGGIFSILPVLGFWMLPAGLVLLAVDIPPLQRPVGRLILRFRFWARHHARRRDKS